MGCGHSIAAVKPSPGAGSSTELAGSDGTQGSRQQLGKIGVEEKNSRRIDTFMHADTKDQQYSVLSSHPIRTSGSVESARLNQVSGKEGQQGPPPSRPDSTQIHLGSMTPQERRQWRFDNWKSTRQNLFRGDGPVAVPSKNYALQAMAKDVQRAFKVSACMCCQF